MDALNKNVLFSSLSRGPRVDSFVDVLLLAKNETSALGELTSRGYLPPKDDVEQIEYARFVEWLRINKRAILWSVAVKLVVSIQAAFVHFLTSVKTKRTAETVREDTVRVMDLDILESLGLYDASLAVQDEKRILRFLCRTGVDVSPEAVTALLGDATREVGRDMLVFSLLGLRMDTTRSFLRKGYNSMLGGASGYLTEVSLCLQSATTRAVSHSKMCKMVKKLAVDANRLKRKILTVAFKEHVDTFSTLPRQIVEIIEGYAQSKKVSSEYLFGKAAVTQPLSLGIVVSSRAGFRDSLALTDVLLRIALSGTPSSPKGMKKIHQTLTGADVDTPSDSLTLFPCGWCTEAEVEKAREAILKILKVAIGRKSMRKLYSDSLADLSTITTKPMSFSTLVTDVPCAKSEVMGVRQLVCTIMSHCLPTDDVYIQDLEGLKPRTLRAIFRKTAKRRLDFLRGIVAAGIVIAVNSARYRKAVTEGVDHTTDFNKPAKSLPKKERLRARRRELRRVKGLSAPPDVDTVLSMDRVSEMLVKTPRGTVYPLTTENSPRHLLSRMVFRDEVKTVLGWELTPMVASLIGKWAVKTTDTTIAVYDRVMKAYTLVRLLSDTTGSGAHFDRTGLDTTALRVASAFTPTDRPQARPDRPQARGEARSKYDNIQSCIHHYTSPEKDIERILTRLAKTKKEPDRLMSALLTRVLIPERMTRPSDAIEDFLYV